MSTVLQAIKNKPLAYYRLDDSSPFDDSSGHARTATGTGTTTSIGLANGFNYSTVFSRTKTGQFDSPAFIQGKEVQTFSLEAWIYPIIAAATGYSTEGAIRILSHTGQFDGLSMNGRVLSFSTVYTDGSSASASYVLPEYKRIHVVGVHTDRANYLYVDGELVAQQAITDAQRLLQYVATDGKLYSGADTTTAQSFAANGFGIYGQALSSTSIRDNYEEGVRNVDLPFLAFGGVPLYLGSVSSSVFLDRTFEDSFDWSMGEMSGVTSDYDNIVYTAAPGTWQTSVPLYGDASIFGAVATWQGINATVETSLDGATWTATTNGGRIPVLPNAFDATTAVLYIRVTLTAGGYIDSLKITGYRNGNISSSQSRTITVSAAASIIYDRDPIELSEFAGIRLNGGTLTIGTDSSTEAIVPQTVEVWIKNLDSVSPTVSTNLGSAATKYTNAAVSDTYPTGEWVVRHYVNAAGVAGSITITGNVQVGRVVLYPTVLSATQLKRLYDSYLGVTIARFDDSSTIGITEAAVTSDLYAYDWAITAGG